MSLDSTRMSESIKLRAIVTGVKAGNTTFTSVSPEIPFLILRDPPGDMSYAELIEEETSETSLSFSTLIGGNVTTWSKTKVGAKFEAGLGFSMETEAWGSVEGRMSIGASNATNEEFTVSMTNTSAYKTDDSGTPELIGSGGDLFVGAALNLLYARADVLSYDTQVCQDTQTVEIIMGTESLKTEFAYTDFFIRNSVMPELAFLRDNGPQDSIVWYQDQIELWQQTLDRNDYLKSIADSISTSVASRSFGGNITLSESTTTTSTRMSEFEFKLEVSSELAVEAGLEVGGAGASGGVQVSMRAEIGLGGSSTNLKSRTTKYVLKDNETLDKHFIRIRECPVYSTPIFEEIGSNTSCPYTPGTVNRDKPTLTVANPIRTGVDPTDGEIFIFTIRNESKSGETRSYYLDLIESSNLNSAIIGENITGDDRRGPFPIGFNEEVDVQIFVSKSQFSEVFSYEDLTFIAYPECDDIASFQPQTSSTTAVSVFFDSPCSDITMNLPQNNWEVSQSSNDILTVNMTVEDIQFMDSVSIEYSQSGKNSWSTALTLDDSEVTTNDIAVDVSDIADGLYDIRLKLYCDGGTIFTSRASGITDREAPVVFGIPNPVDDIYDQSDNDEISVTFEEDIACANASVLLTDMETLEVIPATLGCSDNKACLLYTSPSPRDRTRSRMPSSA